MTAYSVTPKCNGSGLLIDESMIHRGDGTRFSRRAHYALCPSCRGWFTVGLGSHRLKAHVPHKVTKFEAIFSALVNRAGVGQFSDREIHTTIIPGFLAELNRLGFTVNRTGRGRKRARA